jgi:hypothetical protein
MNTQQLKIRRGTLLFAAVFLFALMVAPGYGQVLQLTVPMDGSQEVPPVATAGTGLGDITVDTATGAVSGSVSFTGLTTPTTAGHIHVGAAGLNGPVIVPLIGGVGVTAGTMFVGAGSILLPDQVAALRTNGLYLNIHTTANLGGEIRGQILITGAIPVGSIDQIALMEVLSGNFNPTRMGDELACLSAEGSIFVTLDMMSWMEIPGNFIKLVKGDFNGDGVDDLGGVSGEDGSIRITTDFGLTWMTVALPQR